MEHHQMRKIAGSVLLASILLAFVLAAGALPGQATASDAGKAEMARGVDPVFIRAGLRDGPPVFQPPPDRFLAGAPETATITVTYVGVWDASAQAAFQHAVDIWETLITSSETIEVRATWTNLGGGILGAAGAETYFANFSGAPMADTMYPVALANKLAGTDLDPGFQDINATFNSAFPDWYFGTDGMPPGNKWDFVSVVLHEIGHGLGFAGSMQVGGGCGSGLGCWGIGANNYPAVYDRFTENGSGTPLLSFTNFSAGLATELTSGDVYFNGPLAIANNTGNLCQPVKLYAPGAWQQGSSYSHLDEIFNGTPHALMTFSITNGEAQHHPGGVTLGMFEDMAWDTIVKAPTGAGYNQLPIAGPTMGPTPMGSEYAYLPIVLRNSVPCV
ncbi:MAG: hypothetical protein R3335_06225 [Anaerolineales bacterium]|nr:hypothetical protein [Anaerolineales bacterium]